MGWNHFHRRCPHNPTLLRYLLDTLAVGNDEVEAYGRSKGNAQQYQQYGRSKGNAQQYRSPGRDRAVAGVALGGGAGPRRNDLPGRPWRGLQPHRRRGRTLLHDRQGCRGRPGGRHGRGGRRQLPGGPITFRTTAGARILGSADLSAASWALVAGTASTYSVAYPAVPRKVTVDGTPLAAATSATLDPGQFFYDSVVGSPTAKTLFVRLADGSAPTAHHVEAGRFGYAFRGVGRSHVVVDGFTMADQNNDWVLFTGGSNLAVRNVTVSGSGLQGLFLDGVTASSVTASEVSGSGNQGVLLRGGSQLTVDRVESHHNRFHGIGIQGSTASTIQRSVVWANAKPSVRSAAGISVDGDLRPVVGSTASGNVVRQNIAFDNQDTGIALHAGSTASVVAANLSHNNGDHGYDALTSTNNRLLGNTAAGNFKDGFSIEGTATGTELAGNIAVDNGITVTPKEFNLLVDPSSTPGFKSDSKLFWNSAAVDR